MRHILVIFFFFGSGYQWAFASCDFGELEAQNSVSINAPMEAAYAAMTTPAHWPEWHPNSLEVRWVSGSPIDTPMEDGDQIFEAYKAAGQKGDVVWQVEILSDHELQLSGHTMNGDVFNTIHYRFVENGDGQFNFTRTLTTKIDNPFFKLLYRTFFLHQICKEQKEAVHNIKQLVEERFSP